MTDAQIKEAIDNASRNGPTRVVYSDEGQATTPELALQLYNEVAEVVFIRNDGWTLGASMKYYKVAHDLWEGDWAAVVYAATGTAVAC